MAHLVVLPVATLVALALTASLSFAQLVVPTFQSRTVGGSAYGSDESGTDTDSGSDVAPDFAPFSSGAGGGVSLQDVFADGSGSQTSSILADRLDVFGTCGGFAENYGFIGDEEASSSGSSYFDVVFDLTAGADFTLTGSVGSFDNGSISVRFSGPSGTIFEYVDFGAGLVPVNEAGNLPPGAYRLEASTGFSAFASTGTNDYGSGEFDLDLVFASSTLDASDTGISPPARLAVWPNPSRSEVRIAFGTGDPDPVDVDIFDSNGRRVRTLDSTGSTELVWDARDARGQRVSPGVYYVRARNGTQSRHTKIVLRP